ncbi:FixH family protein [Exiguobacterium antarcticum]|uniref:FixH family protein n=1 Tax=Exiguobacterium antarcticum TaxID=132920 RepID=A0ABT6QXI3_9BACL|nr:FixH family protein [Exiguobacterium antarcticum]MDI3233402.1 FixH family protein [Exiguobacterium antarcticum]
MKKKTMGFMGVFFATGLVLAGCGSDKQAMDHNAMQGSGKPAVDVKVDVPAKTMEDQQVVFQATALENKKAVNLEDVTFEVWKVDKKEATHQKFKAALKKTGMYQAEANLAEGEYEGLYHINDKKGLHHMDKISFVVMNHSHEETSKKKAATHEHPAVGGLSVHYMGATKMTAGAILPVSFHVFLNGEPIQAAVQIEVIEPGVEKHMYLPLTRKDDQFVGEVSLTHPGTATIRLHVENDQLHHHQDQRIIVKK